MAKPKFTPPTMKEKGNEEVPDTIQGTTEETAQDQEGEKIPEQKTEEELQSEADREAEELKKAEEERLYRERLESATGEKKTEEKPLSDTDIKNGLNAISAAIDGEIKRRQQAGEKWRQLKKVSSDLTAAVFHARGIDNGGKSPRVQS